MEGRACPFSHDGKQISFGFPNTFGNGKIDEISLIITICKTVTFKKYFMDGYLGHF
jgi:hypothetical protein